MYVSDRAMPTEAETIAAIEDQLHIPNLDGRHEDSLIGVGSSDDGLATDPDFPPESSSVHPDPHQPPAGAISAVVWRRVSGTLYYPTRKASRLLKGELHDHWFLGAVAAVATKPDLLLDLIVSDELAAQGLYTFQLYKHGCWREVVVDNFLPCLAGQDRLAFACSANVGELWPSLLEKAYAKPIPVWEGLYCCLLHEHASSGGLWRDLLSWLSSGSVVVAQARSKGHTLHSAPTTAPLHVTEETFHEPDGDAISFGVDSLPRYSSSPDRSRSPSSVHHQPHPSPLSRPAPHLNSSSSRPTMHDSSSPSPPPANAGPTAAGPANICGVLLDLAYPVVEALLLTLPAAAAAADGSSAEVDNGGSSSGGVREVRLLRLQCPWGAGGLWHGAWSQGSPEWERHAGLPHGAALHKAVANDDSMFWMSYDDFVQVFSRVHVCRLFPPSWHQLTLHCGWQGPSAGGPYYTPATPTQQRSDAAFHAHPDVHTHLDQDPGANAQPQTRGVRQSLGEISMQGQDEGEFAGGGGGGGIQGQQQQQQQPGMISSTWCCNPQFRLTVRKAAEVTVCVAQRDPQVAARGHTPKRMRARSIGLQVLRVELDTLGRRWEVTPGSLLLEVPLCNGRELSASFRADPGVAYVLVPYPGKAGEEGAFVLRTFSSSPLEVEQLPGPLSLVLGGHWTGYLAGGCRELGSWGSNPQYMISSPVRARVNISVARLDLKYAIIRPAFDPLGCIGLTLAHPETAQDGTLGRRTAIRVPLSEVVAETGFPSMDEAVMQLTLEPGTPYLLVPSTNGAGVEAPFEVRLMSASPLELVALPEVKTLVFRGEWTDGCSGGCDINPLWRKNPRYLLRLRTAAKARITLTRLGKPRNGGRLHPVNDMIGFYVLRAANAAGEIKGDARRTVVAESTFVPGWEAAEELDLNGGINYVLLPCTYAAGRIARYTLAVSCPADFDMTVLS
ncbi:MAG: hypothetical protein WDW38_007338 [Sanguina aurantia]